LRIHKIFNKIIDISRMKNTEILSWC